MEPTGEQLELIGLVWRPAEHPFRLRINDVIRIEHRLGRVIRVSECSAVVLVNRPARQFTTRFDKPVRLQPSPVMIRIAANSDVEIVNRANRKPSKRKPR